LSEEAKGISLNDFKGELEGVDLNKFRRSNPSRPSLEKGRSEKLLTLLYAKGDERKTCY